MFKCSCRRMKCDEGSDAWNNLRISHIHVFLKNLRQHVPRKKNMEFAKVRRKNFFLAKMTFSRWKNLEQPSYIYIYTYIYIHFTHMLYINAAFRRQFQINVLSNTPGCSNKNRVPGSSASAVFPDLWGAWTAMDCMEVHHVGFLWFFLRSG